MYTVELLNESKFAKSVILNWFKQQMLNSFQGTELTKEQIEQYIEDTLAEKTFVELININPRMMFDVFDENEIFIRIIPDNGLFFSCIDDEKPTRNKTRKE